MGEGRPHDLLEGVRRGERKADGEPPGPGVAAAGEEAMVFEGEVGS